MNQRGHGVALFSGGLDSALAILLILRQDIRVTALTFMTHFGCDITDTSSCAHDPSSIADKFGFTAKVVHLGEKFIEVVRHPRHGYGKNMNPCIDCRILMLREAGEFMELTGADFVFTGEVLGQRPMSQRRPQLDLIARESGIKGRLVRPLSGRLLPATDAERSGLLDRSRLEAISGRSRKRQMELAEKFGLEDYPTPAAGCLLTDPNYSRRLRDLFSHQSLVDFTDLNLLKIGRHFRLDEKSKVIVGHHEKDNAKIVRYRQDGDWMFEAKGCGSPLTLLKGVLTDENTRLAAAITARYCDMKYEPAVPITYDAKTESRVLTAAPLDDDTLERLRI